VPRKQLDDALGEPRPDALLHEVEDVVAAGHTDDADGRPVYLGAVEEVVQQRLLALLAQGLELVEEEDDGAGFVAPAAAQGLEEEREVLGDGTEDLCGT
jgi:hypothetical protein